MNGSSVPPRGFEFLFYRVLVAMRAAFASSTASTLQTKSAIRKQTSSRRTSAQAHAHRETINGKTSPADQAKWTGTTAQFVEPDLSAAEPATAIARPAPAVAREPPTAKPA